MPGGSFKRVLYTDVYGFNTDEVTVKSEKTPSHGKDESIVLDVAPMSAYIFTAPPYKPPVKKTTTAKKQAAKKPAAKKSAETKPAAQKKTATVSTKKAAKSKGGGI